MNVLLSWQNLAALLALCLAIAVGLWIITNTREGLRGTPTRKQGEVLSPIKAAFQAGLMNADEFARVEQKLKNPTLRPIPKPGSVSVSSPPELTDLLKDPSLPDSGHATD